MANKGQIYKISFKGKYEIGPFSGYGICIGDDDFILEDGRRLKEGGVSSDNLIIKYFGGLHSIYGITTRYPGVGEVTVSPTRCVPPIVREKLGEMGKHFVLAIKASAKMKAYIDEYNHAMEETITSINEWASDIRKASGVLSKQEFLEAFKDALPDEIKDQMLNSKQKGYGGEDGEWEFSISPGSIGLYRGVYIDKWCTPSFTFLEYDDTRQMVQDAEKNPEYQNYMRKYSKHLNVSDDYKIEEYLSLEDKNTLNYHGHYIIPYDTSKPLTEEYAKELAEDFAGVDLGRDMDER